MTETAAPPWDIPPAWEHCAETILRRRWRRILVIGAADRGKSTYCRFLIRRLSAAGFTTALVDADIGQKDIGPPATVALAYPDATGELARASLQGLYFVGSVTPIGHFLPLVVGTRRLVEAAQADFVIIDTVGLVQGGGRALQAFQIESLHPDAIVTLERNRELEALVKAYRHRRILRLTSSPQAVPKSRTARQAARQQAFEAYFRAACPVVIDIKQLILQRCLLFNGKRLEDPRFIYAERTPEGMIAVAAALPPVEQPGLHVLPAGFERNLLCGLADQRERGLGLALINAIDFQHMTIALLTPVPERRIRVLQFGDLYLAADGRELQRKPVNLF